MPLTFAYGANLDRTGMAERCRRARPLGLAALADHRFFVMTNGYASVRPEKGAVVHGLLWHVSAADLTALDDFEEVGAGLYRRLERPVRHGGATVAAQIYEGCSTVAGAPRPDYLEAVIDAAQACGLPDAYCAELRGWLSYAPAGKPPG